jgi:hypothetical protein
MSGVKIRFRGCGDAIEICAGVRRVDLEGFWITKNPWTDPHTFADIRLTAEHPDNTTDKE